MRSVAIKRMAWLSTAMVAVALALGLFAVLAYRARDEAREQRAQAEGLIEFMLVDLRKRLEPVGRLDALEAVGTRALEYYDSQSLKSLDPDSLGRRARALHLIGEIDDRRGDDKGARSAFARASASTQELLLREPDHPQRLFDHAQSVFWDGYIDWQYGEIADAERAFKEYAQLAQTLSAKDPVNPDWLAEVASAHSNLASLLLEQGRPGEAIPEFMEGLRIDQKRAALSDDGNAAQLDIAQDHSWLSSAYYANRKLGQAIAERDAEMAIYERLADAAPDDAVVHERQVIGHRFLGELYLSAGSRERASAELERALAMADAQPRLDPDNVNWQVPAAQARVVAARLARMSGKTQEAQRHLDAAASLLDAQLRRDPEQWTWRVDIQESIAGEQAALLLSRTGCRRPRRCCWHRNSGCATSRCNRRPLRGSCAIGSSTRPCRPSRQRCTTIRFPRKRTGRRWRHWPMGARTVSTAKARCCWPARGNPSAKKPKRSSWHRDCWPRDTGRAIPDSMTVPIRHPNDARGERQCFHTTKSARSPQPHRQDTSKAYRSGSISKAVTSTIRPTIRSTSRAPA